MMETAYLRWTPTNPTEAALAARLQGPKTTIVNAAALSCVDQLLELLSDDGFLLINDYGPAPSDKASKAVGLQRYGGSVASAVNFCLLTEHLVTAGVTVVAPPGDEQRRIHTRLCGRQVAPAVQAVLAARSSKDADRFLDAPQEEARRHLRAGRVSDAVACYKVMVQRNPDDWQLLGEAAEYIGLQLNEYSAGLQLARAALERNPWYAPWLWNILGNCLMHLEDMDGAHVAFEQAHRIDGCDSWTNLNLAITLSSRGDHVRALAAVANGLAHDRRQTYRTRLLEQQTRILSEIAQRNRTQEDRLSRRAEAFK